MDKVRCKFKCFSVKTYETFNEVEFMAAFDEKAKEEGFSAATPAGNLKITVTKPEAMEFFQPGVEYWLDLQKVVN